MTKLFHRCDDSCRKAHAAKTVKKTKVKKIVETKKITVTNVYSADYALIDETIDNIKKISRSICVDFYSSNNVYLILQDALKKVTLADK